MTAQVEHEKRQQNFIVFFLCEHQTWELQILELMSAACTENKKLVQFNQNQSMKKKLSLNLQEILLEASTYHQFLLN